MNKDVGPRRDRKALGPVVPVLDLGLTIDKFREEVLLGLRSSPRTLPCKYFYDARGARLFEEICTLPEYYLTRVELSIMETHVSAMAEALGPGCCVIEYGSGAGMKVRLLLSYLEEPVAYLPVDLSRESLERAARELCSEFPDLQVCPICADFSNPFPIPHLEREIRRRVVYFPGSTIGNFCPDSMVVLLGQMRNLCGDSGAILIGIDLKKDVGVLEAAYNDSRGVTREFNLNLLHQINRRLGGNFNLSLFKHYAFYNKTLGRIEMHLVSVQDQTVTVAGESFRFKEGDTIHTENSYKFGIDDFAGQALRAGVQLVDSWTDERQRFGVLLLGCSVREARVRGSNRRPVVRPPHPGLRD